MQIKTPNQICQVKMAIMKRQNTITSSGKDVKEKKFLFMLVGM